MMDWIETTLGDGDSDGFYVATADSQQTRLDSKSCIPCKTSLQVQKHLRSLTYLRDTPPLWDSYASLSFGDFISVCHIKSH